MFYRNIFVYELMLFVCPSNGELPEALWYKVYKKVQ